MIDGFKVNRCTRQCHKLQRPLREGEWYYSVVLPGEDEMERRDYAAEAWEGPPEEAIGWWKNRIPPAGEKKLVLAPKEVLIDLLRQMSAFPEQAKSRYLLALMLLRKRLIRLATETESAVSVQPQPAAEPDVLRVEVIEDGSTIEVSVCSINRSESDHLREELNQLLYCEA